MSPTTRAVVKLAKHLAIGIAAGAATMLAIKYIPSEFFVPAVISGCFAFSIYCIFQIYLIEEKAKEPLSKKAVDSKFE